LARLKEYNFKIHFFLIKDISLAEESASKCPRQFQAHKHEIACIAIDQCSHRLATASVEVIFFV
jgi:hypothetical protein